MSVKISIIIPVYNAEPYLEEAIDSVYNQSFSDWEILAINDSSTDNSLLILKEYSSKDNRVRLIDFNENRGQGYARNLAISKAIGDYVLFLDADDFLANDALANLNKIFLKKPKTEVFVWGFKTKTPSGEKEKTYLPSNPNKKETPFLLSMLGRKGFNAYPCVYVVKRNLILTHNISFAEGIFFEDVQFTTQLLYYAKKVKVIKKVCYYYRKHSHSVTGNSSKQKIDDKFTAFVGIKVFLQKKGVFQQYEGLYLMRFLTFCVHTSFNEYFVLPKMERDKELDDYMRGIRKSKLLRNENLDSLKNLGMSLPKNEKYVKKAYLGAYYGLKAIKNRYHIHRFLVRVIFFIRRKRMGF